MSDELEASRQYVENWNNNVYAWWNSLTPEEQEKRTTLTRQQLRNRSARIRLFNGAPPQTVEELAEA